MFQPTFIVPNCHHPLLCYRQYHPPSIRWHHHIYLLKSIPKNCDRITLIRWVGVEAHFPCFSPLLMYWIVIIFYFVTDNIIHLTCIRRCAWLIIYFWLKNASLMIFFNHLLVLKTMLFLFCWMWPSSPFFTVLVAILLFLCQIWWIREVNLVRRSFFKVERRSWRFWQNCAENHNVLAKTGRRGSQL